MPDLPEDKQVRICRNGIKPEIVFPLSEQSSNYCFELQKLPFQRGSV